MVDSIVALKNELANEKQAQQISQMDAKNPSHVVEELKEMADQLSPYVPFLEAHVKTE
jgi:hypothetical protein